MAAEPDAACVVRDRALCSLAQSDAFVVAVLKGTCFML